ncbi:dispersed gene family protein 1 (DGF-1), putative, partial [Trypanosoma cruzi]
FVVPAGVSEVMLRHVVLDGVCPVLYVPWMARDGVRIVVQNVSLRNGAVLYVMGGGALRGAVAAGSDESGPVELSVCDVEALNGALVLTGTFPAGSALTVTDSLLVAARPTPLVYLPGSQSSPYAPVLVLSGLRLVRSVAGCVLRGPRDGDDWWADGGGGRRGAGARRWRCRALDRGCARWRICVVRECARGCVGRAACAARCRGARCTPRMGWC